MCPRPSTEEPSTERHSPSPQRGVAPAGQLAPEVVDWLRAAAPLLARRAALLMHSAAAGLALGVPMLAGVRRLAAQGFVTGASGRNWAGYGADVGLPDGMAAEDKALLTDPQTSGGLLVACAPAALEAVLAAFAAHGFDAAAVVGGVGARGEAGALQLR